VAEIVGGPVTTGASPNDPGNASMPQQAASSTLRWSSRRDSSSAPRRSDDKPENLDAAGTFVLEDLREVAAIDPSATLRAADEMLGLVL
jgi:hypothetical protein